MNKDKTEHPVFIEQPKNEKKLVYEKPKLQTVSLFASEVLSNCLQPGASCQTFPFD